MLGALLLFLLALLKERAKWRLRRLAELVHRKIICFDFVDRDMRIGRNRALDINGLHILGRFNLPMYEFGLDECTGT